MSNLDPIEGSEIMELVGANYVDLEDAKRNQMIQDIIGYFSGREDKRYTILKILSGKSGDGVDIMWNWVQLIKERNNIIKGLPKEQFTGDIQKEIENEYLTRDNIKILKTQLKARIKTEEEKGSLKQERKEEEKYEKKAQKAAEEAMDVSKLKKLHQQVIEVEEINQILDKY